MRTIAGIEYYSPKDIQAEGLIRNSKGNSDYGYILRVIKRGELPSILFNETSQIPYYLVKKEDIEAYNSRFNKTS